MTLDRLQTVWRYTSAEVWRPLFDRFHETHADLPIEVVRTMLVRPRGMRQIFVPEGQVPALDTLRADVARFLDLPEDARAALRRIKAEFFIDGRAIAVLFCEIHETVEGYDSPSLTRTYRERLQRFLDSTHCRTAWTWSR